MADQSNTPPEVVDGVHSTEEQTPAPEVVEEDSVAQAAESAEEATEAADPEAPVEEPVAAEPDWKDKYVRSVAELDNIRKRARRDVGLAEAKGIAKLAKELLPAIDDLDRALAHAEAQEGDDSHPLTAGIRAVQQQLLAALTRVGITTDSPKGERFDPHRHEALTSQPVEGVEPGVVVEVFQPGYVYEETVLRAAKVVVSA